MKPNANPVEANMSQEGRLRHPGLMIVTAFGAVIGLGAVVLSLSVSHAGASSMSFSDAVFTAVSAVTVTGLVVVDTGTAWSPFGELVILALIQVGGLGVMTLAAFMGIVLNQRLGLRGAVLAGTEIGMTNLGVLRNLVRDIVRFVLASEVVLAVLLTARFLVMGDGLVRSLHLGLFHAVSAFNNAGFSIFDSGLEQFVGDWYFNVVIALGFIVGGLGFPVVFELGRRWRQPRTWSLHTKVTLGMTGVLLSFGTAMIFVVEWTNEATFGALGFDERVLASFFQSATARTAGFNTISIGSMRPASWMVLILLMVIGAGSASTGGGIKISTFAVVIKSTMAELRGDHVTTLFERTISTSLRRQALALVVAALGTIGTAAFLLMWIDASMPFGEVLFEAASAFGTVGVSTGLTAEFDFMGRAVIMVLMFIGRVGPITFGTAVLLRSQRKRYGYAEEEMLVG
ncbi:TrkH family potassium uptake protein [Acidimicrobiaceae bacterium AH-315-P05]|nr:TrkH family potassium uptake protein [Acidimicrobiaceae bacterium AH-315-P05]